MASATACGIPDCRRFPWGGVPTVFSDNFHISTCGTHTHAEFVAYYQREGRRAAVAAYERLVIEAAIRWAAVWSPWTPEGVRAARTLLALTAALVAERQGLEAITGSDGIAKAPDVESHQREG